MDIDGYQAQLAVLRLRAADLSNQSNEVIAYTRGLRQDARQLRQWVQHLRRQRPAPDDAIGSLRHRHPGSL